jgi:hypothetical protein
MAKSAPPTKRRIIPPTINAEVIAHLLAGCGPKEAAERAGIYRQRIWEWRRQDAEFQAMLEEAGMALSTAMVDEAVAEAVARIRTLAPWAVIAIEASVAKGNIKAAGLVLRYIQEMQPKSEVQVTGLEERLAAIGDSPSD